MNMIESAKAQVRQLTVAAYEKAAAAGLLPAGITAEIGRASCRERV